jgi:hypothetical protein
MRLREMGAKSFGTDRDLTDFAAKVDGLSPLLT